MPNAVTLNHKQHEAVTAPAGPLMVLAGAGSGKTRVLTHRIEHLIVQGTPPEKILALTFTNKAAKEMRERVAQLVTTSATGNRYDTLPLVTTFHSFGVRILREFHREVHLKKYFPIYDRSDSMRIVKNILKDMDIDTRHIEPRTLLSKISKEKGRGTTPEAILEKRSSSYFIRTFGEVWHRYEQTLKNEGAVDFDDLIMKTLNLLRKNEVVRQTLQQRFDHLLLDEYQDTNVAQADIAYLLAARHQSITVVGDIDQNIYSWRGAHIGNILSFEEQYPGARVVVLEQNYRSTKTIVDVANTVIEKNVYRREKYSFTENEAGNPIHLFVCENENTEAQTIAQTCQNHIAKGEKPGSIAILYRTNFQSRVLEDALLHAQVPYQVLGTKFFDRKEVKDVLAYVRLALIPESMADIARIINVPARGIGKVTQLAVLSGKTKELSATAQAKVCNFYTKIETMRAKIKNSTPSSALVFVIQESGLETLYQTHSEEDTARLENMRELVSVAKKYDHLRGEEGLLQLLDDATLMGEQDSMKDETAGIKLMTIHAAKGLEFDTVFITGCEEGLFPHERSETLKDEDREEERRLFYVALTRAHKQVYLSLAQTRTLYGSMYATEPSSFIEDIPHDKLTVEQGITAHEKIIL